MKKFLIIRHAESTANAGEKTDDMDSIPLSEKGKLQAKKLAEVMPMVPDLIVVSPYARTRQTAEPFIAKYPDVPVEVWDVHEFTYLHPDAYNHTTKYGRFGAVLTYWKDAPVDWKASDASESFLDFTTRIQALLEKVKDRKEERIVIFSHGRFIRGLKFYLQHMKEKGAAEISHAELTKLKNMHARTLSGIFPILNASVHEIEIE
jgi:probable phosphoglycerate mutase